MDEYYDYVCTLARKAQFLLLIIARKLPIDIQCDMFVKVVSPKLLYGSEVWGFSCTEMLEIFHRNFLKKLLHIYNVINIVTNDIYKI